MTQETAHERTAIDFTEFEKAIEETSIFTHVEDAMWVTDKAHELIKVNNSVSTEEISVEKMQEELDSCIQTLISVSILANGDENIVIGNFVDSRLSKLAKTHQNVTDYIERVTGKSIDVVLAENAALEAEEE